MGTAEEAPLALVVTGTTLDSAMVFAKAAEKELYTIAGASEIKLSVETGNPEINVQVDRDKIGRSRIRFTNRGNDDANCFQWKHRQ